MANNQETLIYIEKENHTEAEFMSRNFVNKELKNRAYLNALGAELVTKYLTSEGIKCDNVHNLHSISKILESVDIADILLPNVHLDVRVVFDEKYIFIPKSHFELELVPNAYVVLKLDEEFKHVELLGYFKPSQIDKRNENGEYYFIDRSKLSSPTALTRFVKDFTGRTSRDISEEDLLRGRELAISLADHNISVSEEKELLELLLLSDVLRESVLEFDNFETLSYSTAPVLSESLVAPAEITAVEEDIEIEEAAEDEETIVEESTELEPVEEISLATMAMDEELDLDAAFPEEELEETLDEDATPLEDPVADEEATDEEDDDDDNNDSTEEEIVDEDTEEDLQEDELAEETLEEVEELDLADIDMDLDEETSEETAVIEDELEVAEETLEETSLEESTEEVIEVSENEDEDEDESFIDELNEAAAVSNEEPALDNTEEELSLEEPSAETIVEDEEVQELEDNLEAETIDEEIEETEETEVVAETEEIEIDEAETIEFEEPAELDIIEDTAEETTDEEIETIDDEIDAINENIDEVEAIEEIEEISEVEELAEVSEEIQEETLVETEETLPEQENIDEDLPTLDIDETPALEIDPTDLGDDLLGGNLVDENNEIITTTEVKEEVVEEVTEEEPLEIEEAPLTPEEPYVPQNLENLSVDSILDQTIAAIDTPSKEVQTEKVEEKVEEKQEQKIEPLDVAAAATATALAGAVAKAAEEEAQAAISEDAIKLAAVSGEMINNVVQNLEDDQQKSLDKIDYAKTDITVEIDAPEHMIAATEDLSIAKMEASLEAERSGKFGEPTDLENLNEVEVFEEEEFIQDSVDFGSMETVSKEELFTQGNENLDLDNLADFNMNAGANNLPDLNFNTNEEGVVDLPQFSSGGFTISEDGTSPMDAMLDMSIGMENKEEELMDMGTNGENSPLDENALDFSSCMKPSTRKREESSSHDDKPKPTIDEATRQALLANNIVRSDDDDDDSFASEDFGETIVIDDDEPFVIDAEETTSNDSEIISDEADISELLGDEILADEQNNEEVLTEDSFNEVFDSPAEEVSEETLDELALDELETMSEPVQETSPEKETLEEVAEIQPEQQDWLEDTDYTNLEDVEIQPQESVEDFITEPTAEEKTYAVKENSAVISDKSFQAGEIFIDINAQNTPMHDEDESLASIYNPNSRIPGGALLQTPGRMSSGSNNQGNAARGLLTIVGTLIVLALVGGIGFGVSKFFKTPTEEAPQPITEGPLPSSTDNGISEANTLKIDPNNVVKMDNNTNTLASTKTTTKQAKQQALALLRKKVQQKLLLILKKLHGACQVMLHITLNSNNTSNQLVKV